MFWGFAVWADRFWADDFWEGELPSSPIGGGGKAKPRARPFRPSRPALILPRGWRDREPAELMAIGLL